MTRLLLGAAFCTLVACGGCKSAPPYDEALFFPDEAKAEYDAVCDASIGIVAPLPTCSAEQPCDRILPVLSSSSIVVESEVPECGPDKRLEVTDSDGVVRYYCQLDAGADAPMPLIVWLHGSGGNAENLYDNTSLRKKATSFDLGGPQVGFMFVSIQGRNLHWPTIDPRDGSHHDVFHRDLSTASTNRDIALLDLLIDELVDEGQADPSRIYVMGWSNGMHFAQMYGIARHETPTPGGHRVAAVAGFSAADPFHNRAHDQEPSCQLDPYPKSTVPIFLVSRACDAVPCSDAQYARATAKNKKVAPGTSQEGWLTTLAERVEDPNAERIIIDDDGKVVSSCEAAGSCGVGRALLNHVRWPNGVADRGGVDHEPAMLDFLRDHPLPSMDDTSN